MNKAIDPDWFDVQRPTKLESFSNEFGKQAGGIAITTGMLATPIDEAKKLKVGDPEVNFGAVMERRAKVVKTLTGGVSGLFKKNKIDYLEGHGALTGAGTVRVGSSKDGDEIDAPAGTERLVVTGRDPQGADRFMVRGLTACAGEWTLHCVAHNLKKATRPLRPPRRNPPRQRLFSSVAHATVCRMPRAKSGSSLLALARIALIIAAATAFSASSPRSRGGGFAWLSSRSRPEAPCW